MSSFDNNVPTKFPNLEPRGPAGELLLAQERAKATFDVNQLSKFMYGEEWLNKMDKVLNVVSNEPAFSKTGRYYESREDKIANGFKKDKRLVELVK